MFLLQGASWVYFLDRAALKDNVCVCVCVYVQLKEMHVIICPIDAFTDNTEATKDR